MKKQLIVKIGMVVALAASNLNPAWAKLGATEMSRVNELVGALRDGSGAGNGQLLVEVCEGAPRVCKWVTYEAAMLKYSREYFGVVNLPNGDGLNPRDPFQQPYARELEKWLVYLDRAAPALGREMREAAKTARFVYVNLPLAMLPTRDYPASVVEFKKYKKAAVYMPMEEVIYISIPVMSEIAGYFEISDAQGLTRFEQQGFTMLHELFNWAFGAHGPVFTDSYGQEVGLHLEKKTIGQRLALGKTVLISRLENWSPERLLTDLAIRGFDYWKTSYPGASGLRRMLNSISASGQIKKVEGAEVTLVALSSLEKIQRYVSEGKDLPQIVQNASDLAVLISDLSLVKRFEEGDALHRRFISAQKLEALVRAGKVQWSDIYSRALVQGASEAYLSALNELNQTAQMLFAEMSEAQILHILPHAVEGVQKIKEWQSVVLQASRAQSYEDLGRLVRSYRKAQGGYVACNPIRDDSSVLSCLTNELRKVMPARFQSELDRSLSYVPQRIEALMQKLTGLQRSFWDISSYDSELEITQEMLSFDFPIDVVVVEQAAFSDYPDMRAGQVYRIVRKKKDGCTRVEVSLVGGPGAKGASSVDHRKIASGVCFGGYQSVRVRGGVIVLKPVSP